jgi:hypothetical protein
MERDNGVLQGPGNRPPATLPGACGANRRHTLASAYRVMTVDGVEEAEKLLNATVGPETELVHSHIETVREQRSGEQENTMLEVPVTRFMFIFKTV